MVNNKAVTETNSATRNATIKLLKYDLKWVYKVLVPLYFATLACAVLGRLLDPLQGSFIFDIIRTIFLSASIGLMINIYINNMARLWVRLSRNFYGDESYLTHTLPISPKVILRAKVLAAIITTFTTLAAIVLGLMICFVWFYGGIDRLWYIGSLIELIAKTLDLSTPIFVLLLFFVVFIQAIMMILSGYAGIILGHRSSKHKTLRSILLSVAFYGVAQILAIAVLLVAALFVPNAADLIMRGREPSPDVLRILLISIAGLYTVYTTALYHIGQKILAKGVDVD